MPVVPVKPALKRISARKLDFNKCDLRRMEKVDRIDVHTNVHLGPAYESDQTGIACIVQYKDDAILRLTPVFLDGKTLHQDSPAVVLELKYFPGEYVKSLRWEETSEIIASAEYFTVDDYDIAIAAFKRRYYSEQPEQYTTLGKMACCVMPGESI